MEHFIWFIYYVWLFQNEKQSNMNYDDFLVEGPVMELFKLFPQSYKPLDLYGDSLSINGAFWNQFIFYYDTFLKYQTWENLLYH